MIKKIIYPLNIILYFKKIIDACRISANEPVEI